MAPRVWAFEKGLAAARPTKVPSERCSETVCQRMELTPPPGVLSLWSRDAPALEHEVLDEPASERLFLPREGPNGCSDHLLQLHPAHARGRLQQGRESLLRHMQSFVDHC